MNFGRKSTFISLLIATSLFLFSLSSPIINPIFGSILIFFFYYFLLYWLLDFDVLPGGFIYILLLSSIYVQIITLFMLRVIEINSNSLLFTSLFAFILFTCAQVINRMSNVANVSSEKKIPLFQISQSFNFIFAIICIFIGILTLELMDFGWVFSLLYVLIMISVIIISNLFLIELDDAKSIGIYSVIAVMFNVLFAFITLLLPYNIIVRPAILALLAFIFLGGSYITRKNEKFNINVFAQISFGLIILIILCFSFLFI